MEPCPIFLSQLPLHRIFKMFSISASVQGGIALTSQQCNKKQTSGLTEKGPVRLSNTCSEMGVVKVAS